MISKKMTFCRGCACGKEAKGGGSSKAEINQRKTAAVLGALVADAAAQPLTWIYKDEDLRPITLNTHKIEFYKESKNPFYRIPTGCNTCYGDELLVMLKSLVEGKGVNVDLMSRKFYEHFGPASEYELPPHKCASFPYQGKYRNGCVKHLVKAVQNGETRTGDPTDEAIDGVVAMIPVVAMYAGKPDMLEKVEKAVRVLQDSNTAIACILCAAIILEKYILEGDPKDLLDDVNSFLVTQHKNMILEEFNKDLLGFLSRVFRELGHSPDVSIPNAFSKN